MKQISILSFCLLVAFVFSFGQKANFSVQLKGAQTGIVKLVGVYGNQNVLVDSAESNAESLVTFKSDTLYPEGFYYVVYQDNSVVYLLIDKDQEFSFKSTKENWIDDAVCQGSLDNELYYKNLLFEKDFRPRIDSVSNGLKTLKFGTPEYEKEEKERMKLEDEKEEHIRSFQRKYPQSFFTQFKVQGQNPKWRDIRKPNGEIDTLGRFFIYRSEYWKNYDWNDVRLLRSPVFYNKLNNYLTNLIPQNPDSLVWAIDQVIPNVTGNEEMYKFTVNYIAMTYKQSSFMDWEKIYSHVILKYVTYEMASWADSAGIKRTREDATHMTQSFLYMPGQDLNCPDDTGAYHTLYANKKDFTILYIFNPDCEHFQKETPVLIKFYNEWKSKGVEVYALTLEQKSTGKWVDYKNKTGMPFVCVWDPGYQSLLHKYYVDNTPEIYLMNKKHQIIGKNLKVEQLKDVIEREIKKENGGE